MRVSLNEIEVTLKKAAIGAGFATGLAEDVGRGCGWLATRGFDAAGAGLSALQLPPGGSGGTLGADGCARFTSARIARDGVSALDLLLAGEAVLAELDAVDSPLLLVGLAGIAAAAHGGTFRLDHSGGTLVVAAGSVMGDVMRGPGASIRLTRQAGGNAIAMPPETGGCEVVPEDWAAITALAARLLVPESTASRDAGAGAGAIDND